MCMNTSLRCLFTAGIVAATALTAQARIERTVEKTFSVTGAGTLKVETQGAIRVLTGSDNEVKVSVLQKFRADTDAEADEALKKLEFTMEQSGSDVTIVAKYERLLGNMNFFGSWPPVNVDVTVTVPASYSANLRTSGGGINVGDLNGKLDVHTSGGGITLGKTGGTVKAHTSGGGISLAECRAEVELHTSGGPIKVGKVAGPADLNTSGGGIEIESVMHKLRAHTSGGGIRAAIVGPLQGDCELSTSGGGVRVTVDKAAAFNLDASTSGGHVDAQGLTITLGDSNKNHSKLAGAVNGGGPVLKLHTSGGGITVRAQ
jgi:hypothetical protein